MQDLIRAIAANDAVGIQVEDLADGFAQHEGAAFGVDVHLGGGVLERFDRLGAWA